MRDAVIINYKLFFVKKKILFRKKEKGIHNVFLVIFFFKFSFSAKISVDA